jgi:hypothetical protein
MGDESFARDASVNEDHVLTPSGQSILLPDSFV